MECPSDRKLLWISSERKSKGIDVDLRAINVSDHCNHGSELEQQFGEIIE